MRNVTLIIASPLNFLRKLTAAFCIAATGHGLHRSPAHAELWDTFLTKKQKVNMALFFHIWFSFKNLNGRILLL